MSIKEIKTAIKSNPFFYNRLLPRITQFRKIRRRRGKATPEKQLRLFQKLCKRIPQFIPNPVFVKVGANDGITGDPISYLLLNSPQWNGLLIEPVPYCFERLKENFGDTSRFILEQAAVGASAGKMPFYYVAQTARECHPDLPFYYDQLGSFDRNHILKHLDGALESYIVQQLVTVLPLDELLQRNKIDAVHLLHIDAEGHDYEVLKTLNLKQVSPILIFIEYNHLSKQDAARLRRLLQRNGYSIRNTGRDYLAIHKKTATRLRLYE